MRPGCRKGLLLAGHGAEGQCRWLGVRGISWNQGTARVRHSRLRTASLNGLAEVEWIVALDEPQCFTLFPQPRCHPWMRQHFRIEDVLGLAPGESVGHLLEAFLVEADR